eukprot:7171277-Pyramimonas_sp.AAC.1
MGGRMADSQRMIGHRVWNAWGGGGISFLVRIPRRGLLGRLRGCRAIGKLRASIERVARRP